MARKPTNTPTPANLSIDHGRFIESMLTHCDLLFSNVYATALANEVDSITFSPVAA